MRSIRRYRHAFFAFVTGIAAAATPALAENVAADAFPLSACGDPFAHCEQSISESCLNPATLSGSSLSGVPSDSPNCAAEWARFDQCLDAADQICATAGQTIDPAETVKSAVSVPPNETRIALVIGNSEYGPGIGRLENPKNDAALMAETLRGVGFEVMERTDLDFRGMKRAIGDFGDKLVEAGGDVVALFFFAGHGVQLGGKNYLIPINAPIKREKDVPVEAVPANDALEQMRAANARINMVFLDACRNNPFENASFRSLTRGLARMNAPRGTLISFATGPGEVAEDGDAGNSPFTLALTNAIRKPGLEVEAGMKQVRTTVLRETKNRQLPWTSSSVIGNFFFLTES